MPPQPTQQSAAVKAMTTVFRAAAVTKSTREFVAALDGPDVKPHLRVMEKAFGVQGAKLATQLFAEAGTVFDHRSSSKDGDHIIAGLQAALGMKPRGPMESMIVTQLLRTHSEVMIALSQSHRDDFSQEVSEIYLNRAMRLMRLSLAQAEMLARIQGRIAQQKIVVERIDVGEGGQAAIVGQVSQGGGAEYGGD
jgi:hypothetical protein